MISTSNWMCKTEVKEQIKQKLSAIPRIEVNPRAQCYRQAARKSYTCVKRYVDHRHLEPSQKAKTVMASLPCTYDGLKDICPQGEALFYTILNYDWLVLPPALGVNVSDTLLRI
ncbi:uncharacterized protein LOC118477943 [Aplysia californica]|uniref:Uncharacterized protein LOC118477943 n=1 Tax=Aplysia californica TaxID=6500 RepID=A0ABM1VVZ1_APLCA|nr:uncharacterized protein LOC118477943 [Aplysia californica]